MSSRRLALSVCGLLLALQLLAVWSVPFVPTQDGPVHLEIAAALRSLWQQPDGPLAAYYALNSRPEPNLLSDVLLAGLTTVAGCRVAEKLLLSLFLVLLPASFVYCLRALRRDSLHLAVLVVPLGMSFFFHMGFHNFNLAVPLSLFALGYWLRHEDDPGWRAHAIFGVWLLATTAAHAVPAAVVMLAVGVLAIRGVLRDLRSAGPPPLAEVLRRRVLGNVLAGLPAAAMLLVFLAGQPRQGAAWLGWWALLRRFVLLQPMISYDRREHVVVAVYGVLVGGLAVLALLRRRRREVPGDGDGLLWIAGVLVALYFALPAGLGGGGYLNPRLQFFALLVGLLWLGTRASTRFERRVVLAAGAAVSLGLLALHVSAYRRLGGALEEYVSVQGRLPADSSVLPVSFLDEPVHAADPSLVSYKIRPYEHAIGYLACGRPLVDLANYQADQGYFAIVYRPWRNPYSHLLSRSSTAEDGPPTIDLAAYGRYGGSVDAVLIWGRRYSTAAGEADPLLAQLAADYDRVFTSSPRGLAELYLRHPSEVAETR